MNRLVSPFSRLRWKLTLTYTAVTVAALLVAEIVVFAWMSTQVAQKSSTSPDELLNDLDDKVVPMAQRFLSRIPPDVNGLHEFLATMSADVIDMEPIQVGDFRFNISSTNILYMIFINSDETLIGTLPNGFISNTEIGEKFDPKEIPGLEDPLQAALLGEKDLDLLTKQMPGKAIVGALPIIDEKDEYRIIGAIAFARKSQFWEIITFANLARQLGIGLLFITLFAGLMGAIFGSLTAGALARRLKELSTATNAWSQGDFSVAVNDMDGDELGVLAQSLNNMAHQLENLLVERQAMSVVEERNRLARDLHDSVKQQAFAASAQLAAARVHLRPDPKEAEIHLIETEKLLYEVRQELTDLIQELRPIALQGRGLPAAIREFALDCANQAAIEINVRILGERSLPLEIEQTLFRIAQGALANVIRHSRASHADVWLIYDTVCVKLVISDNGCGFDTRKNHHGLGLQSMRERVEALNGSLTIKSRIGRGTKVTVKCDAVIEQDTTPSG
jgi:signal transduction histidine kinase